MSPNKLSKAVFLHSITRPRARLTRITLLAASLSLAACVADAPLGSTEQAAITPLPSDLDLTLNAKTTVMIGSLASVNGDVASTGAAGSVIFDVSATQGYYYDGHNTLANTVEVRAGASAGRVIGNDIFGDGSAVSRALGLDPATLPPIPDVTPAAPKTANVSVGAGHMKQICPGQYGAISLGTNATLGLNGGVYHLTKLVLADGARLEPSEPVVLLVAGGLSTGTGAFIRPYAGALRPMTAADIRIELGGSAVIGPSSEVRAHLLLPSGRLTTGKSSKLTGAAWANSISIGISSQVQREGTFLAQAPAVPPPCNDDNRCTDDQCVGGGTTLSYCRNTLVPSGTSCSDGNLCDGAETCNSSGGCVEGPPPAAGTSCADSNGCDGDETCNGNGSCVTGPPPAVNDSNACTTDACDPATGVSHVPLPDGSACYSTGVCEAGACSIEGPVFSYDFVQYQSSPGQCASWDAFRSQLSDAAYDSITMSGTFDPIGVTCDVPSLATQICQALHDATSLSVTCNGRVWSVGGCSGVELTTNDNGTCQCGSGYTARPCYSDGVWGGMGTETCNGPSQTMTVICE
jgi:hypothetical protein